MEINNAIFGLAYGIIAFFIISASAWLGLRDKKNTKQLTTLKGGQK